MTATKTFQSVRVCYCGHQCTECGDCAYVATDGPVGEFCGANGCAAQVDDDPTFWVVTRDGVVVSSGTNEDIARAAYATRGTELWTTTGLDALVELRDWLASETYGMAPIGCALVRAA